MCCILFCPNKSSVIEIAYLHCRKYISFKIHGASVIFRDRWFSLYAFILISELLSVLFYVRFSWELHLHMNRGTLKQHMPKIKMYDLFIKRQTEFLISFISFWVFQVTYAVNSFQSSFFNVNRQILILNKKIRCNYFSKTQK